MYIKIMPGFKVAPSDIKRLKEAIEASDNGLIARIILTNYDYSNPESKRVTLVGIMNKRGLSTKVIVETQFKEV